MNFLEPQPTPFDVRWRMFGIPVRVHPTFWLFSALWGWMSLDIKRLGYGYLLLWVGCMLVSVLVHEMGHALSARMFGPRSHIVLYSFGGLAIGQFDRVRRWQRVAIALAGPAAGLTLYGLVQLFHWQVHFRIDPAHNNFALARGVNMLLFMNLFWNLLNLVPVYPLDGGQVLHESITAITRSQGQQLTFAVSFVIAASIAVYSFVKDRFDLWFPPQLDPTFNSFFFAYLALQSLMSYFQAARPSRQWQQSDWR